MKLIWHFMVVLADQILIEGRGSNIKKDKGHLAIFPTA